MDNDFLTIAPIPAIGGELSGGEAVVIESFADLAALQGLCASVSSIGRLWEAFRSTESLRPSFPSLREDWRANAARYRDELQERIEAGALLEAEAAEPEPLDQLRVALDLAERIWANEESDVDGERSALLLLLAVAQPGAELELTSEQAGMLLASGSIRTLWFRAGELRATARSWLIGLFSRGTAPTRIARDMVKELRSRRLHAIRDADRGLLGLPRLDELASDTPAADGACGTIVFLHGLLSTDVGTFDGFIRTLDERWPAGSARPRLLGWPHDTLTGVQNNAYQLAALLVDRVGTGAGAIVFVCHSRGGLLARAAALQLYDVDVEYRRVLAGCVSFGAPHEGAELAQLASGDVLAYLVAIHSAIEAESVLRLSDLLLYANQQENHELQGLVDLRPPVRADSFIGRLRDAELKDPNKPAGRMRAMPLFAVGGRYDSGQGMLALLARGYFGRDLEHDLVVPLESSIPTSADQRFAVECHHSGYCADRMRSSPALVTAVDQAAEWLRGVRVTRARRAVGT